MAAPPRGSPASRASPASPASPTSPASPGSLAAPAQSVGTSANNSTLLTQAKVAIANLRYDEAQQLLEASLVHPAATATDLAQAYLCLGVVERVLENRAASERAFALALLADEHSALPLASARKLHVAFAAAKTKAAAKGPWRIQLRATAHGHLVTLANDPLQLAASVALWRNGMKIEESPTGRIAIPVQPADLVVIADAHGAVLYQWQVGAQAIAIAATGALVSTSEADASGADTSNTHLNGIQANGANASGPASGQRRNRGEAQRSVSHPQPPLAFRSSAASEAPPILAGRSESLSLDRHAKPPRLRRWQTWAVPAVTATAAGIGLGLAARHFESSRDRMLTGTAFYPEVALADGRAHTFALAANLAFAASAVTATVAIIVYFQHRGDTQPSRKWQVGAGNSPLGITMRW